MRRGDVLFLPPASFCVPQLLCTVQLAVERSGRNSEKENTQKVGKAAACDVLAATGLQLRGGGCRAGSALRLSPESQPARLTGCPLDWQEGLSTTLPPPWPSTPLSSFYSPLAPSWHLPNVFRFPLALLEGCRALGAAKSEFSEHICIFSQWLP